MESHLRPRNRPLGFAKRIAVSALVAPILAFSTILGAVAPSIADDVEESTEVVAEAETVATDEVAPDTSRSEQEAPESQTDATSAVSDEDSESTAEDLVNDEEAPAVEVQEGSSTRATSDISTDPIVVNEEDGNPTENLEAQEATGQDRLANIPAPEEMRVKKTPKPFWCTPGTFYSIERAGQIHFYSGDKKQWDVTWGGAPHTWEGSPQQWAWPPPLPSSFLDLNGIGISPTGEYAYAYQRENQAGHPSGNRILTIMKYSEGDAEWHKQLSWNVGKYARYFSQLDFVTGAVNSQDEYYFAASRGNSDKKTSSIYLFKFASGAVTEIGKYTKIPLNQSANQSSSSSVNPKVGLNGDAAFDPDGNLHMVFATDTGKMVMMAITAQELSNAANVASIETELPLNPSVSKDFGQEFGFNKINGIAFDYDGNVFIGDKNRVMKIDPWTGNTIAAPFEIKLNPDHTQNATHNGETRPIGADPHQLASTDLASCAVPSSLKLRKHVKGRKHESDQFELSISRGDSGNFLNGVTSGAKAGASEEEGLQDTILTTAVKPGSEVTIEEKMAAESASKITDYSVSWKCTHKRVEPDGNVVEDAVLGTGTGPSATITIPTATPPESQHVTCTFVNDPNPQPDPDTSSLKISKVVDYGNGYVPDNGWTVGAVATLSEGSTGEVSTDPNANEQVTQLNDDSSEASAEWEINYTNGAEYADITVSETEKPGFVFNHAECTIKQPTMPLALDPSSRDETISWYFDSSKPKNNVEHTLTKVQRFSTVECTYYNDLVEDLTLIKIDADTGDPLPGVTFQLYRAGADGKFVDSEDLKVGDPKVTTDPDGKIVWEDLALGTYFAKEVSAPAGYQLPQDPVKVIVASGEGIENIYKVENNKQLGTVMWQKADVDNNALLAGSEWELKGPDSNTPVKVVTDCVTDELTCPADSLDRDPAAGKFKVEGLKWGSYTLVETKAPAGYQLLAEDAIPLFEINDNNVAEIKDLGQITNEKSSVPGLPLTGGLGSDVFVVGGGLFAGGGGLLLGLLWRQRKRAVA